MAFSRPHGQFSWLGGQPEDIFRRDGRSQIELLKGRGRLDRPTTFRWNESGRVCAEMAKTQWLKVDSNTAEQRYDPRPARSALPEPMWPTLTLNELLKKALPEGKLIRNTEHIVFRLREGLE